jgi:MFS transporter, DHA1 family, inner membrane transport protein
MSVRAREAISVLTFLPLYLLFFLIGTETFLVSPLLPSIAKDFREDVSMVAHTVTSYVLVYALFAPWLGNLSDRVGRKMFIVVGAVIFCFGNILASISTGVWFLIVARAIAGLGGAMAGPAMWAYISDETDQLMRGRAIGYGMAAFSLGQVVGVPLGSFIAGFSRWNWAFGLIGISVSMVSIYLFFRFRPLITFSNEQDGKKLLAVFEIFQNKTVVQVLAITFFFQAANLGAYTYLGSLLGDRYQIPTEWLGLTGVMVGVGSFLGSLIGGKLADYWRRKDWREERLVAVWSLVLGTSILGVTVVSVLWLVFLSLALWFLASGAFVTAQQTLLTIIAPKQRAASISWNNSVMYAGTAIGVWIMGLTWNQAVNIGWISLAFSIFSALFASLINSRQLS